MQSVIYKMQHMLIEINILDQIHVIMFDMDLQVVLFAEIFGAALLGTTEEIVNYLYF